ncbi:MAG: OmpA family protein [Verrucomicrobia bacterium]|nr:OmpA family protein [Verrucomicrobiota bacterium]
MNAISDYEAIEQTPQPISGCQLLLSLNGFPIREYGFRARHDAPLNQLVDQLASQDQSGKRLLIVGHADDGNAEETNRRIARLRAAEVLWQLRSRLQQRGLNIPMDYEGRGSTEPVAAGGEEADHKGNRRVEVFYCADEPVAVAAFSYPAIGWRRFWPPGWARRASMLRRVGFAGPGHSAFPWRTAPIRPFARPVRQGAGVAMHPGPRTPIRLPRPVLKVPRLRVPTPRLSYSAPRRMAATRPSRGRGRSR